MNVDRTTYEAHVWYQTVLGALGLIVSGYNFGLYAVLQTDSS